MNFATRRMMLQALKVQVDVCRLRCECLSSDLVTAPTPAERAEIAHRWDQFLRIGYTAQIMLDLLAGQDRDFAAR
jgi:hypothetical protein